MSDLKILLSTFWRHPVIGGSAMYIEQLKHGLENEGHEVDILAKHPTLNGYHMVNTDKYIDLTKINMVINKCFQNYFHNLDPIYKNGEKDRHCFEMAASYFNLETYDLIHTQDIFSTRLLSRVKPNNTPLVASIHGCIATEYLIQKGNSFTKNRLSNSKKNFEWEYIQWQEHIGAVSSDVTIVATKWLKDLLTNDFNVEANHLKIIPYAQDINEFQKRMTEMSPVIAPTGKTVIVCPARLVFIKGHKFLLEALAKLKRRRTDWVCWLVGDGNLRTQLVNITRKLNLDQNVKFLGPQENIPAILKHADICVLPSLQESFPYAIMEAQIAGKPVVVTDAGGMPEAVIHGQTGLISPRGNSESLFHNINELLENGHLRNVMASNALKCGKENWALEKMIDKTLAIYEQVIKIKRGGDVG
ncbi:glycosyltransferase family 4 protein [Bacillus sp. 7884-1]|uniref:glycosyltransferase family 4 protein n=1 Tax=Bacillus sp. 7884-1 TaxID=2021693 RepID=UPI00211BDD59|nr:glycosyltransferase family 4 protein [Bacillus sp. 7884-1]